MPLGVHRHFAHLEFLSLRSPLLPSRSPFTPPSPLCIGLSRLSGSPVFAPLHSCCRPAIFFADYPYIVSLLFFTSFVSAHLTLSMFVRSPPCVSTVFFFLQNGAPHSAGSPGAAGAPNLGALMQSMMPMVQQMMGGGGGANGGGGGGA
jgi:hypothetical protein